MRGKIAITLFLSCLFLYFLHFFNQILNATSHSTTLLFLGGMVILPILIMRRTVQILTISERNRAKILDFFNNLLLVFFSIIGFLIVFEVGLARFQPKVLPDISSPPPFVMPEDYKYQNAKIEGAVRAFYWQQKLHVFDKNLFRHTSEFPPKKEGVFRIMVLGDSHTWGFGIAAADTYPALLEKELGKEYSLEVLNLGLLGAEVSTYLETLKKYVPLLQPDLVVNGITLNDFVPQEVEFYSTDNAFPFPLPNKFKQFLIDKTLVGKFFGIKYNTLLFALGLRNDYLSDFIRGKYQERYAKINLEMNDYVLSENLPPIVALVIEQAPGLKGKDWQATQITEKILKGAGFQVIPAQDYFLKYNGQTFFVTPEEKHPNEEAHWIFAQQIANYLKALPELQKYRTQ